MNRLTKLCCLIASALVLMLAAVPSALAHAHPTVMKPAPDSTGLAPSSILITFSEGLEPKFSSIRLTDERGKAESSEVSRPAPADPKTITLAVPMLTAGTYIVHWVSVAVDGHRLEGSYKFTVQ
jgi:methionine-rich copper-binding protein CopC